MQCYFYIPLCHRSLADLHVQTGEMAKSVRLDHSRDDDFLAWCEGLQRIWVDEPMRSATYQLSWLALDSFCKTCYTICIHVYYVCMQNICICTHIFLRP